MSLLSKRLFLQARLVKMLSTNKKGRNALVKEAQFKIHKLCHQRLQDVPQDLVWFPTPRGLSHLACKGVCGKQSRTHLCRVNGNYKLHWVTGSACNSRERLTQAMPRDPVSAIFCLCQVPWRKQWDFRGICELYKHPGQERKSDSSRATVP